MEVADAHRRLGFSTEAVHLYQTLVTNRKVAPLHEAVLIGLGESYLDQFDPAGSQERVRKFSSSVSAEPTITAGLTAIDDGHA